MSMLSRQAFDSETIQIIPEVNKMKFISHLVEDRNGRENFDDGFYVCDIGDIVEKHKTWQTNFPRVTAYFAVKSNPDPNLLKTLINLGTGFDCASQEEIRQMLDLGVEPDRIIFAHPSKQSSHVCYARDNNVKLLVFDNAEELVKLKKHFPTADLVLRVYADDSLVVSSVRKKFGARIETCYTLIDTAYSLGLNVVGICFHVGNGCQNVTAYKKPIQDARKLFDYAKEVGYNFNFLDIGGGFPGSENVNLKFEKIAEFVTEELEKSFPVLKFPSLEIIAEPGRFYCTSTFTLVTNIIAKQTIDEPMDEVNPEYLDDGLRPARKTQKAFSYFINDGLHGAFILRFYSMNIVPPVLLKSRSLSEPKYPSRIWGPTCDEVDKIIDNIDLPELNVLEWIGWPDKGAYTTSCSSAFNGFKTTKIYYFISENQYAAFQQNSNKGLVFKRNYLC